LEFEILRRLFHARGELVDELGPTSFEHFDCVVDVLAIVLRRNQAHAWARAALDLILQARPRAIREEAVAARSQQEELLKQKQGLTCRARVRVRAEEAARKLAAAAIEADAGIFVVRRNVEIRKALV